MSALGNYYNSMAAKNYSETGVGPAQAGLANAQAGEVAPNAASERALKGQQGGLYGAESGKTQAQTAEQLASTAFLNSPASSAAFRLLHGSRFGGGSGGMDTPSAHRSANYSSDAMTPATGASIGTSPYDPFNHQTGGDDADAGFNTGTEDVHMNNYSGGAPRVPGVGDGATDKVHAMLAPGEAVLNKGAAEHVGRGLIKHLNDIGAAHMAAAGTPPDGMKGMPPGKNAQPGLAKGPVGKPPMKAAMGSAGVYNPDGGSWEGPTNPRPLPPMPGRAMGDENVQEYSMGTENVQHPGFDYATTGNGHGNPEAGGGMPAPKGRTLNRSPGGPTGAPASEYAPRGDEQGTTRFAEETNLDGWGTHGGKGMPKRPKGYAKGTARVGGHAKGAKSNGKGVDPAVLQQMLAGAQQQGQPGTQLGAAPQGQPGAAPQDVMQQLLAAANNQQPQQS